MTLLLLAVLLPLVGGAVLPLFRFQQERPRSLYVEAVVLVTSALTWWAICLSPEGELPLDLTGKKPGRGAYVCRSLACLQAARKARRLEKAFSCQIPAPVYERMEEELQASDGG